MIDCTEREQVSELTRLNEKRKGGAPYYYVVNVKYYVDAANADEAYEKVVTHLENDDNEFAYVLVSDVVSLSQ